MSARCGDHSSRSRLAARLQQPTRGFSSAINGVKTGSVSRAPTTPLLRRERVRFREVAQRAGPALPSYLALHHAGFSRLPILLPGRWALTPPFHPCQTKQLCLGDKPGLFSKTSHRFPCAMPPCCSAGGIFSVALSVTEPHRIGLNPTPHAEACNSALQRS